MLSWRNLTYLSDNCIGTLDVAEVQLACAADLPGSDRIDIPRCLKTLDRWAMQVKQFTEHRLPRFRADPAAYENSEPYFRALAMVTVLQRDLGLRYNPEKTSPESHHGIEETFIHGAIFGGGGTCATMPVIYAAVGRRLGYPIKLVSSLGKQGAHRAGHFFARWDDKPKGEYMNIEATGHGLSTFPDDYYRTGDYTITPAEETNGLLLKSQTPRQELAGFLAMRGHLWLDTGRLAHAINSFGAAWSLSPENHFHEASLKITMTRMHDALVAREFRGFPPFFCKKWPDRRFPGLPEDIERSISLLLAREVTLFNQEYERRFWSAVRARGWHRGMPTKAVIRYTEPDRFQVDLVCDDQPHQE